VRSYDERAEFEEPCTRNRIGSGVSPVLGAPTRLRQRLRAPRPSWPNIPRSRSVRRFLLPRRCFAPAREKADDRSWRPPISARALWAPAARRFEPFMGRDLIRAPSGLADGTSAIRLLRKRTCRSANPRAAQRILLLVFDHRLERQSGAIATRDWQSDVATTIWWECLREKANASSDGVKTTGS
jgi:hypothetical protein